MGRGCKTGEERVCPSTTKAFHSKQGWERRGVQGKEVVDGEGEGRGA